jgi:hypothetical protein
MIQTLENTFPTITDIARPALRPAALQNDLLDKALAASQVPRTQEPKAARMDTFKVENGKLICVSRNGNQYPLVWDGRDYTCVCKHYSYHRNCRHSDKGQQEMTARAALLMLYPNSLSGCTAVSDKPCAACGRFVVSVLLYDKWIPGQYGQTRKVFHVCGCGVIEQ